MVDVDHSHLGALLVTQLAERLPRSGPEGLLLLRRVNLGQADLHLLEVLVQDGQSVAVGDGYYEADDEGYCAGYYVASLWSAFAFFFGFPCARNSSKIDAAFAPVPKAMFSSTWTG